MKRLETVFLSVFLYLALGMSGVLIPQNLAAQGVDTVQDTTLTDVDGAFMQARQLAFDGEREEARELAYAILEVAPEYLDVRILVARTWSWDGRHEEARRELAQVFEASPRNREAFLAAIDNERWDENREEAMRLAYEAVSHYPNDEALLMKQAQVFGEAGDDRQAARVLNRVIQLNPSNSQAREFREGLADGQQRWSLAAMYTQDQFTDHYDTYHNSSIGLTRETDAGPLTARFRYASRFGTEDWQGELEMYPTLGRGWYAYLNAGYSGSVLFPEIRGGADLYRTLGGGFEGSLGMRYLWFNPNDVTMVTGSVTWYVGSWMWMLRPYITPTSEEWGQSWNLTLRRYFADADTYLGFRAGYGFSPEDRRLPQNLSEFYLLESLYVGLEGRRRVTDQLIFFMMVDAGRQELLFDPGSYVGTFTFNGGIRIRF